VGWGTFYVTLQALRLTVFAILAVFEPIIRVGLSLLAVVGICLCLFNRYATHAPHFPFWLTLGLSVGCALALVLFYRLMRFLTP
jgi:hypothetical protein